jgi:hypothetical protein
VPDDDRGLLTQGFHHGDVVLHQLEDPVSGRRLGLGGAAVAADVEGDRSVAGRGERGKLVAPGVPGLRKAVNEQDQRAGSLLHQMSPPGG